MYLITRLFLLLFRKKPKKYDLRDYLISTDVMLFMRHKPDSCDDSNDFIGTYYFIMTLKSGDYNFIGNPLLCCIRVYTKKRNYLQHKSNLLCTRLDGNKILI